MKTFSPHRESRVPYLLLLLCTIVVCLFLFSILFAIFSKGLFSISFEFITQIPTHGMTQGGILPAIVGTLLLTFITACVSLPFGIACAVYLNEYAENTWLTQLIRAAIRNLAGVPSIIFGEQ